MSHFSRWSTVIRSSFSETSSIKYDVSENAALAFCKFKSKMDNFWFVWGRHFWFPKYETHIKNNLTGQGDSALRCFRALRTLLYDNKSLLLSLVAVGPNYGKQNIK